METSRLRVVNDHPTCVSAHFIRDNDLPTRSVMFSRLLVPLQGIETMDSTRSERTTTQSPRFPRSPLSQMEACSCRNLLSHRALLEPMLKVRQLRPYPGMQKDMLYLHHRQIRSRKLKRNLNQSIKGE